MEIMYWWLAIILLIIVTASLYFFWHSKVRSQPKNSVQLAHLKHFTGTAAYEKARARRQLLLRLSAGVLVLAIIASSFGAGRYISSSQDTPSSHARDIILCLDVSGSVTSLDVPLLKSFKTVVTKLQGERVGLVVFNALPLTLIPLTDDYSAVESVIQQNINSGLSNDLTATFDNGIYGSSNIGSGLLSCAQSFDNQDTQRSRSIIIATDNDSFDPHITFTQAAAYAKQHNIHIFVIDTLTGRESPAKNAMNSNDMKSGALSTGGAYYTVDQLSVPSLIAKINAQQATLTKGLPSAQHNDQPLWPIVISASLFSLYLLAVWRLKL